MRQFAEGRQRDGQRAPPFPVLPRPLLARRRLPRRIERPHHADPREQRLAVVLDHEHQRPDRCLPFRRVVLALRQLGDEVAGIPQGDQVSAAGSGIGSSKVRSQPRTEALRPPGIWLKRDAEPHRHFLDRLRLPAGCLCCLF
jgi:hypothetical protein